MDFLKQGFCFSKQFGATLCAGQIDMAGEGLKQKFRKRCCSIDSGLECLFAQIAYITIGIVLRWQKGKRQHLLFGQCFQAVFQSAPGGFAAGCVAVKAEDHPVDHAQEFAHMCRRCCRAECCYRVTDAVLRECHDIHVAFDNDHGICLAAGFACLRQAEDFSALFKERRFR